MEESRRGLLAEIYQGWRAKLLTGVPIAAGAYQFLCDQFGFPTIPRAWGMTGATIPWWGWLLIGVVGAVYGLFEYVRRRIPPVATETAIYDDSGLRAELAADREKMGRVIDDYQRMLGLEAKLNDRMEKVVVQLAEEAAARVGDKQSLSARLDEHRDMLQEQERNFKFHTMANSFALLAIWHRERLLSLADIAQKRAAKLIDALANGKTLNEEEWEHWQKTMLSWQGDLVQWSAFAVFYLGREPMDDIRSISADDYEGDWTVTHDQFPDPEGLRIYKTFRIYLRNWRTLREVIHDAVRRQAFEGKQTNTRQFPDGTPQ